MGIGLFANSLLKLCSRTVDPSCASLCWEKYLARVLAYAKSKRLGQGVLCRAAAVLVFRVANHCSLACPHFELEPYNYPSMSEGILFACPGSLLCFSEHLATQFVLYIISKSLFYYYYLRVFSALYCCVGEAQGREGLTMHCGAERSCSVKRVKVVTF